MKLRDQLALIAPALLAGCTVMPTGPTALVLPGNGKTFDQFRADDFSCRNYAQLQSGGNSAQQANVNSAVRSGALGTVLGAAIGAAADGHHGAGVGAGTGLAFGTMAGVGAGSSSAYGVQQQYDFAYQQCMYAQGHRVPVAGNFSPEGPPRAGIPPPNAAPPH